MAGPRLKADHDPIGDLNSRAPGLRSLLIGAAGAFVIGAGLPYGNMVLKGSNIASYYNTPAALILFFFLVLVANSLAGLARRFRMLSRSELGLIYIMWIVATALPEWGLTPFLVPHLTSAIYWATPENNWSEILLPLIPDWIIVHHGFSQIKDFFEGAPEGRGVPWELWLRPLAYWVPFLLALCLAMVSIMAMLRKQWIEHERFIFPLVQTPLAMVQDDGGRQSVIHPFFRNRLMWGGFAVPAIFHSFNGLHHYFPFIPRIMPDSFSIPLPFFEGVGIGIILNFQMLGFSYFISREIAAGLCFFHLINLVQQGTFNLLGIQRLDSLFGAYSYYTNSIVSLQCFGAIVVLVLFGLWTGRGHLIQVWRKAVRGDVTIDDSGEIMSYRAALFTLAGSLLFMGLWMAESGLPQWIAPIYLLFAFVLFLGVTRVVCEGGLAFIFVPMTASDFVTAGFGTRALGSSGIIALSFTAIWASDILTSVMASCANGLKVVEETITKGRRLVFWGIMIAVVVTLCSSIWAILDIAYRYGGINTDSYFYGQGSRYTFEDAARRLQDLEGPHWENWGYTAIGAAAMGLLMVARQRLLWWPFHPLGFPISAVFGAMFSSVLLAWLVKTAVLKYGGVSLYMKTRPFFMGLTLGQFVTAGVWYVVDFVTGTSGNVVMSW